MDSKDSQAPPGAIKQQIEENILAAYSCLPEPVPERMQRLAQELAAAITRHSGRDQT